MIDYEVESDGGQGDTAHSESLIYHQGRGVVRVGRYYQGRGVVRVGRHHQGRGVVRVERYYQGRGVVRGAQNLQYIDSIGRKEV